MTDYEIVWQITIDYDRLRQIMTDYDRLWWIMIDYDRLWQIMTDYDRLWQIMTDYDRIWQIMTEVNQAAAFFSSRLAILNRDVRCSSLIWKVVSSANNKVKKIMQFGKSLMKFINKSGPSRTFTIYTSILFPSCNF
jgi:hypothetical protein